MTPDLLASGEEKFERCIHLGGNARGLANGHPTRFTTSREHLVCLNGGRTRFQGDFSQATETKDKRNQSKMKYIIAIITSIIISSCGPLPSGSSTASDSGIQKKTVAVTTDANGWSVEQKNVAERLKIDNLPGSIKHLYIISPYSGQTIIYSTVRGKVTSGGKRLSPTTVEVSGGGQYASRLRGYDFGSRETAEVLQDDGTYGSSRIHLLVGHQGILPSALLHWRADHPRVGPATSSEGGHHQRLEPDLEVMNTPRTHHFCTLGKHSASTGLRCSTCRKAKPSSSTRTHSTPSHQIMSNSTSSAALGALSVQPSPSASPSLRQRVFFSMAAMPSRPPLTGRSA